MTTIAPPAIARRPASMEIRAYGSWEGPRRTEVSTTGAWTTEHRGPPAIVPGMKRVLSLVVAAAVVGVLVTLKARSGSDEEPEAEGSWELADEPTTS